MIWGCIMHPLSYYSIKICPAQKFDSMPDFPAMEPQFDEMKLCESLS